MQTPTFDIYPKLVGTSVDNLMGNLCLHSSASTVYMAKGWPMHPSMVKSVAAARFGSEGAGAKTSCQVSARSVSWLGGGLAARDEGRRS